MVHWRCGGSWEMVWFIEDVVTHGKWCGSLKMWWLMGNGVVHWRCGSSLEMVWLIGDMVSHWK